MEELFVARVDIRECEGYCGKPEPKHIWISLPASKVVLSLSHTAPPEPPKDLPWYWMAHFCYYFQF